MSPVGDQVLITGAGGFVGRHLAAELGGQAFPTNVDATDTVALAEVVRAARPRAVVHLAARSSVAGPGVKQPMPGG